MNAIVAALGEQQAELDGLLAGLEERAWDSPTPACPGCTVPGFAAAVLELVRTYA